MTKKLYLVDGYGFVFRAYHVMPPLTNPEGIPVGAVYGFTNMLMKLLKDHKPDYMAVTFDAGRQTFRNEIYSEYKAHRPEAPDDLKPQFALVREAATAAGLKSFELVGYEADDIIATFCKKACDEDIEVIIISADKDLMQLVNNCGVKMYDPVKNKYIGEKEVFEKFGVTPDKVLDVCALIGDASDNVPGVPSIGPKTAAELINEYGDLDTLLARAGEIKQNKRREVMLENKEKALLSRDLIRLRFDVPLEFNFEELKAEKANDLGLLEFARKHGFKSIVTKISVANPSLAMSTAAEAIEASMPKTVLQKAVDNRPVERKIITQAPELSAWLEHPLREGLLAIDFVGSAAIALSSGKHSAFVKYTERALSDGFDFGGNATSSGLTKDDVQSALAEVYKNPLVLKILHNLKDSYSSLIQPFDDVQVMEYVLSTGLTNGSLESIAPELAGYESLCGSGRNKRELKDVPAEELSVCAFGIVEFLAERGKTAKQELFTKKLLKIYEKIEKPLIGAIARTEKRGAKIDRGMLGIMSAKFAEKMAQLEKEIYAMAGREFNIGSPMQISEVLFNEMGMSGGKKSKKSGNFSTGAKILDELAEQGHEIAQKILSWRQLSKLKSTYTDSLPKQIDAKSGRVHTIYNMTATSTGRLSSTEPNLQNIPIRTEEGRQIRTAFIAEDGYKLISADYSQIELRLLAHVADIPELKEAFKNNQDIHAITAQQVFGISADQVDAEYRRRAKTINFGIIYGISAHGLAERLKIPRNVAAEYIAKYFEQYSGIKRYMDETIAFCRSHGYVETAFGRRCYIRGINDKNGAVRQFSERAAINAPLQGAAADIIKKAMNALDRKNFPTILQVHDELLFEVKETEAADKMAQIKAVMENVAQLSVPLLVEAAVGNNWGEAH